MGMFDKDKEIGTLITNWITMNTPFIVWSARITRDGDYPTKLGMATQSTFSVSRMDTPGDRYDVTTLASAIAAKVREATPADFPAVVQLAEVNSPTYGGKALVLQFLKPWTGNRGGRPEESTPDAPGDTSAAAGARAAG